MAVTIPCGEDQLSTSEPEVTNLCRARDLYLRMKSIPWRQIWESMLDVPIRSNPETVEILINSLVEEALSDGQGAWARTREKAGK